MQFEQGNAQALMLVKFCIPPVALAADQSLRHGIELIANIFEALLIRQSPVLLCILNPFVAGDTLLEQKLPSERVP